MLEEILKIIYLVAIGQGILVASVLFFSPSLRSRSMTISHGTDNKILFFYILTMLLPLWEGFISIAPEVMKPLSIPYLFWILPWLYGPLLYLYVRAKCRKEFKLSFRSLGHFSILLFPILVLSNLETLKLSIPMIIIQRLCWALVFAQMFTYIGFCFAEIKRYQKLLANNYSFLEKLNIIWLKRLLVGFVVIFLLDMGFYYVQALLNFKAVWYFHAFVIVESLYVVLIGFFSMRHPTVDPNTLIEPNGKYEKSSLDPHVAARLAERIVNLMDSDSLYLLNDLTLQNLAERLNVSSHHVSQVINDQLKMSFYELVNQKRIDYAKHLLANNTASKTILDIGYEVGFNNKTSFNNAFKKFTGMTPSEFRKQFAA
ncbi:helix-turn-helix domain-containing protein [Pleionea litopenaei]|uniref:Helix-turn-helix domain-containing protein n=1 Tax=Pleionea litopenaei TaxID=3070815 RepID=A0AA51RS67_9GAMM|nr:helix-turn-helix domain-containing protein [Pleionea sp. HL-JVS1]WMS86534.1 helix-turn-helix domain-containing protein [Pleionea sp. HL-JVS1]